MSAFRAADLARLSVFAHELADLSGAAILPYFRRALRVDNKAAGKGFDPVTAADRAAERVIAKAVADRYPEHGLEGEEFGIRPGTSPLRWIIDPIDGTRAFILGLPLWGTLIALQDGEQPILGLMDQPFTRERFWSTARASYLRGPDGRERRLKTRRCPELSDAMLTTTHPDMFKTGDERAAFDELSQRTRSTRYGGDCYAYCLLAAGLVDVIVEAGLKSYDIAALIPVIEKAGGRVTSWDGGSAARGGQIVATGDPALHDKALRVLGKRAQR